MKKRLVTAMLLMCAGVYADENSAAAPAEEKQQKKENPVVKMVTTKGEITIELYADKAPVTVENFLKYTKDGFYEGTCFHRVWKGFMIQGGGFTPDLKQKKTKKPIKNESYNKIRNSRGTIAMARTDVPDSATCQFFINHVNNKSLDFDGPYAPGYAVFGKVIKGMKVVDAIAAVQVKMINPSFQHLPIEPIIIKSVTVVEKETSKEQDKQTAKDDKKAEKTETDKKK